MKRLIILTITTLLVLTGCTTQTEATITCSIPNDDVERFDIAITGTPKTLSKVVITTAYTDSDYDGYTQAQKDATYEGLLELFEDQEGVVPSFNITDLRMKSTVTIDINKLQVLPDAFALTGLKSVSDLKAYGAIKLIEDFKNVGAVCK